MRDRANAAILSASCKLFALVMPLYPAALRNEFGPDMAEVFEQQIRDESAQRGFIGVVRVWFGVARDVAHSAVPTYVDWRRLVVPVLSLVASFLLFAFFFTVSSLATRCVK